jgi:hypothetical protein
VRRPVPIYHVNSLRHFAASLMIDEGLTPKKVQMRMGHSSIQVTYDLYGHCSTSAMSTWPTPHAWKRNCSADDRTARERHAPSHVPNSPWEHAKSRENAENRERKWPALQGLLRQ